MDCALLTRFFRERYRADDRSSQKKSFDQSKSGVFIVVGSSWKHDISFSKMIDLVQDDCLDRKHLKLFYCSHRHLRWNAYIVWSKALTGPRAELAVSLSNRPNRDAPDQNDQLTEESENFRAMKKRRWILIGFRRSRKCIQKMGNCS
jgi:hypothetical protein